MQILLIYGHPDKDTLTAWMLITQINRAREVAGWNNPCKLSAFFMVLQDKALVWFDALRADRINNPNWDMVLQHFICNYKLQFTARTQCANFSDLNQWPGENAQNFYGQVVMVLEWVEEDPPAYIDMVGHVPSKQESYRHTICHFWHLLFISRLRDDIWIKVMEANRPTVRESLNMATDTELFNKD